MRYKIQSARKNTNISLSHLELSVSCSHGSKPDWEALGIDITGSRRCFESARKQSETMELFLVFVKCGIGGYKE